MRSTGTTSSDISAIWADALLVVYLAATTVPLLLGANRVPTIAIVSHVAVLAAIASAAWIPIVPAWLRRWAPMIVLLFLYSEIPALLLAAGQDRLFDTSVMGWDAALFRTQPARVWAERWPSRALGELLHAGYLSYYAIIFAVPAILYAKRRLREFDEAVFVLMMTFVVCFTIYLLFPVAGPRYLWPSPPGPHAGIVRTFVVAILESRSSRGTAFPSSHVAVAVTQTVLALRYFGRRGVVVAALTVLLAAGAVYGGFHYAVDVLAGAALGVVVSRLALAAARLLRERDRSDVRDVVAVG